MPCSTALAVWTAISIKASGAMMDEGGARYGEACRAVLDKSAVFEQRHAANP
jgi:hypothetical protein